MRTARVTLRRAVIASVGFHIALAIGVIFVVKSKPDPMPAQAGIDTRSDVVVRMLNDDLPVAAQPPAVDHQGADAPRSPFAPGAPIATFATFVPRTLPLEMIAIIRRPVSDSKATQVAGASPTVPAIHGALDAGKTVVYVIDCSGSMGEFGKFARAHAALLATLGGQKETVRFQVVAYNSAARALLPGAVPATAANVEAAENRLVGLEAKGRSNHAEAVRIAMQYRPDVILLLTDATDLSLAHFKPSLAGAGRPVAICIATVTPTGVGSPQELR